MQPDKFNGGWEINGPEEVVKKWGVTADKILDYLSLTGDTADNVPGVKGVGDKTALKLLTEYKTLDGIYEHADEIKGALGEKIRNDKDNAYFSKKLITLCDEVPVEIDFDSFKTDNLNFSLAAKKLSELGAFQISKMYSSASTMTENGTDSPASKEKAAAPVAKENIYIEENNTENTPREIKQNATESYRYFVNENELASYIDSFLGTQDKTIAFDTETTSLDTFTCSLVGLSLCCKEKEAVYVPIILPGEMFAPQTIGLDFALKQLERLFSNPEVTIIMHNAKFDIKVLYSQGLPLPECRVIDTMVAAYLLNPDREGKGSLTLETLSEKFLGLKGIEFGDIVPKGKTFADVELENAYRYGAEDSDFTFMLWKALKTELEKNKEINRIFYETELPLLKVLVKMEIEGIHLNAGELESFGAELKEKISILEKNIFEITGSEFNISSTKQLQKVLFEDRKLKPLKKNKTGFSTDTSVLEELLQETDDPILPLILSWRSLTKLQTTYVETLPLLKDKNSRIHTSFLQTGTATGRLSSQDPNLQNIPVRDELGRRIRTAFTAGEGKVLISADYSQIELVVLAHLSGDKNMCKAFNEGIDVHKATASLIYSIPPEEVTGEKRRNAKTINFGIMYGMSSFRLAKDLGISRTEAKNFIDNYFNLYSGIKEFISRTISNCKETGYVQTISGRKRYISAINSSNKIASNAAERIAINSPIQGSAADIVKKAMLDIDKELQKKEYENVKMLLQVHDELIFECPDDKETIEKTIALIKDKMENAYKLNVPLRVSIEYGKNWGLFH